MKWLLALIVLSVAACEQQDRAATQSKPASDMLDSTRSRSSKAPSVVPRPKDQAALDRMILAGYTPHGAHLHSPGVKECPISAGNEAVM